ncbi:MAG TPA: DUF4124 domain-containing protein [Steroidobacteraceae bacterium]|nr:DUF4124 domain-containing protein [Steroidobacteraceae bacterium]
MYRHGLPIAVALIACALATSASADIWKWVDADGHVQYSDRWTPGAVLIKSEHASNVAEQKQEPDSSDKRITAELNREEAQRQVQKDEAAAHADQCKKATDRYNQLVAARRIYNTDSNGGRQYLSDAQADQERVDAKMDMDSACGTGNQ